jgi:Spy/CpxP family protein refolding chaperone
MKTPILFLTLALFPLLAAPLHAQDANPAAPAAKQRPASAERVKTLTKALALKPDQEEELREIVEKNEAPRKKIRADQSIPEEERKGRLKQITKAEKEQIKAILSPEQKTKWEQLQARNAAAKAAGGAKAPDAKKSADNAEEP